MARSKLRPVKQADKRFRELVIYICGKCESDRPFGATKLNKLLFFSDFLHFLENGRALTGYEYQKLAQGPCPKQILPVLKELERRGEIEQVDDQFFGYKQTRTLAKRKADLSVFSAEEIAFVDSLIEDAYGRTAKEMSELSHDFIGWQLAATGEIIPYEVALVGTRAPTKEEIASGMKLKGSAKACLSR